MKYIPNKLPFSHRVRNIILSIVLIMYGGYGVYVNNLYLPGSIGGFHFQDNLAVTIYVALVLGAISFILEVVDHYDERDNQRVYQFWGITLKCLSIFLFSIALFLESFG